MVLKLAHLIYCAVNYLASATRPITYGNLFLQMTAATQGVTIWEKIGLQYFYFTIHYALYMYQNISPIAHYMNYFISCNSILGNTSVHTCSGPLKQQRLTLLHVHGGTFTCGKPYCTSDNN